MQGSDSQERREKNGQQVGKHIHIRHSTWDRFLSDQVKRGEISVKLSSLKGSEVFRVLAHERVEEHPT